MTGTAARITVAGDWHQASVVSACFAQLGHSVVGVSEDGERISALNQGRAPIHEPGLDDLIREGLSLGRLRYTTDYADALDGAEFAFLAIDTPVGPDDESDLTPIDRATTAIAQAAEAPLVLCVSAQVPIGTCDRLQAMVSSLRPDVPIRIVYVPEFLRLGVAIQTFREADRFVVGAPDRELGQRVAALYTELDRPIYLTDVRSAEMAKHASNAFLALSISFINQIADLCEVTGADVQAVEAILRLDRRVGPHAFLSAGMGYAGGTLGREIRTLQALGRAESVDTDLLEAVEAVNRRRLPAVLVRLKRVLPALSGRRVAILGLTYKPGTSTLRRSAALELAGRLLDEGAAVATYDALASASELSEAASLELANDPLVAVRDASAVVLAAPWPAAPGFDLHACAGAMRDRVLVDTANYLDIGSAEAVGFTYVGVGRGHTT